MLYREEAGDGVVLVLSAVSWVSAVANGFSVLNKDVAVTVSVSLVETSDIEESSSPVVVKKLVSGPIDVSMGVDFVDGSSVLPREDVGMFGEVGVNISGVPSPEPPSSVT